MRRFIWSAKKHSMSATHRNAQEATYNCYMTLWSHQVNPGDSVEEKNKIFLSGQYFYE